MSRLSEAEVFVTLVEAGGFSAAARLRGVTQSAISRRIAALEDRLGVRLLVRSTRRLRLSESGRNFYERCRGLLADLEEAEREVVASGGSTRGVLRLTAPPAFARHAILPRLGAFTRRYPEISVQLMLAERYVDLAEEGFELAIRLPTPGTSPGLIATRLSSFRMVVCCAPAYLQGRAAPAHPVDLAQHACLVQSATATQDVWTFRGPHGPQPVRVGGPLRTNDIEALCVAALGGLGIAMLPSFVVEGDLASGALQPLLEEFAPPRIKVWAVYHERRHLSPRVRVFLDWLVASLRG